jgi:heme o synthase
MELINAAPGKLQSLDVKAHGIAAAKGWLAVYADLFKARLTLLVLLTTLIGFYLGSRGGVDGLRMLHTLLATGLLAGGGAALNELLERDYDAKMRRTQNRPLPSGRLQPRTVLAVGAGAALAGMLYLGLAVNALAAGLGGLTFVTYVFVYTPLKRVTWLNTAVGAIPGALPPLIGWAAARGELTLGAFALFAIQGLWQVPHFMAIAWIYRDEYAKAGFKMLPVLDPEGRRTSRQTLGHALALLPVSLCPFLLHVAGVVYLAAAVVLSLAFLWTAAQFVRHLTIAHARRLFLLSIVYLPLLLGAMVLNKV